MAFLILYIDEEHLATSTLQAWDYNGVFPKVKHLPFMSSKLGV